MKENTKEKTKEKDQGKISLEETQKLLKKTFEVDERNIKISNPRKSVFSEQKWENTGKWEELVGKGSTKHKKYEGRVRMLYTPVLTTKVDLPSGMVNVTYGPQNVVAMFGELINTSTKAFQRLEHTCRNMSSTITPISRMGSKQQI